MIRRRKFLTTSRNGLLALGFFPGLANRKFDLEYKNIHSSNPNETVIYADGIQEEFSVMQITDSHISQDDETDLKYQQFSKRMANAFIKVNHYKKLTETTPLECFDEILSLGLEENIDLLALTGDIVNYPSQTAVNIVYKKLERCGIPYFYVAGNHDWHYEGMEGSADQLRNHWIEKSLKPLYQGDNPLYFSKKIHGVNLVVIDNSTYQINQDQLEFYLAQKSLNIPIILFMHIPIYMVPDNHITSGHPNWGAQTDRLYELERRERWSVEGNKPSTEKFIKEVFSTDKLIGVFTGHWHRNREISFAGKFQHVTGSALNGQFRIIRLKPYIEL